MKTTVEIADSLFHEAKSLAQSEDVSLRQLIDEGLRNVVACRQKKTQFTLRDGSFRGKGPGTDLSWPDLRRAIYKGRGE